MLQRDSYVARVDRQIGRAATNRDRPNPDARWCAMRYAPISRATNGPMSPTSTKPLQFMSLDSRIFARRLRRTLTLSLLAFAAARPRSPSPHFFGRSERAASGVGRSRPRSPSTAARPRGFAFLHPASEWATDYGDLQRKHLRPRPPRCSAVANGRFAATHRSVKKWRLVNRLLCRVDRVGRRPSRMRRRGESGGGKRVASSAAR